MDVSLWAIAEKKEGEGGRDWGKERKALMCVCIGESCRGLSEEKGVNGSTNDVVLAFMTPTITQGSRMNMHASLVQGGS